MAVRAAGRRGAGVPGATLRLVPDLVLTEGGGGIGYSIHAGMVVVADGTPEAARRLERVLTTDPGTGVMRHADAGYPEAVAAARRHSIDLPGITA